MHIFWAMPVYECVLPGTVGSLLNLTRAAPPNKLSGQVESGRCNVHDVRNQLVDRALSKSWDALLSLDADVEFTVEHVAQLIRAMTDGVGIVAGVYPARGGWCPCGDDIERRIKAGERGLVDCNKLTTGLMLIRRAVFEQLPFPWFETRYEGREFVASDWLFARKVQAAGWRTLAHLGVRPEHGCRGTRGYEEK